MNFPEELKYTKEHEWIKIEGDIATIGITEFATGELGDIVYIEIETVGDTIEKDGVLGTIEAVKTVSDIFMPLTGEVLEVNPILEDEPEKVNEDPYGAGWMVKFKVDNADEIADLMESSAYSDLVA